MGKKLFTILLLFILCITATFGTDTLTVYAQEAKVPSVTVSLEDNFSGQQNIYFVFDAEYYANTYPDVVEVCGTDTDTLFAHYLMYGINEGRNACKSFNLNAYKEYNPDLVAAYGDDPENVSAYFTHYLTFGKDEGRIATY